VAAFLAADHARLGETKSTHVDHYRGIKGEDQACESRKALQVAEKLILLEGTA
jgi:hypothetical protein